MILGMTPFTFFHVVLSLVDILSGFVVVYGFLTANRLSGWAALFLATTFLTSATGYLFPYTGFKPSYVVGGISILVLLLAMFALYSGHLAGGWRRTYVLTSVIALYLNVFVLVAQLFMKVPALNALAPTGTEPPFKIAQLCVLLVFVLLGIFSAKGFAREQIRTS